MINIASTTKYVYCFSGILCGLKYARIDRKGFPPGPGQGEYLPIYYILYYFSDILCGANLALSLYKLCYVLITKGNDILYMLYHKAILDKYTSQSLLQNLVNISYNL